VNVFFSKAWHSGKSVRNTTTKAEIAESLIEPLAKIVASFGIETIVFKDGTFLAGSVVKEIAKTLEWGQAAGLPNAEIRRLGHRFTDHARRDHVPNARLGINLGKLLRFLLLAPLSAMAQINPPATFCFLRPQQG
jgi:hypothetical protein